VGGTGGEANLFAASVSTVASTSNPTLRITAPFSEIRVHGFYPNSFRQ
jgi:hypothetical protein